MLHEIYKYTDDGRVNLKTYLHDEDGIYGYEDGRGAIIVLPGGAYSTLVPIEAEPVALTFMQKGYNTFVLNYSIGEYSKYPDILIEVSWAIKLIRDNAKEWNINPRKVILMGFSAGACLAAMSASEFKNEGIAESSGVKKEYIRPDAAVIAYGCFENSGIWKDPKFANPKAADFVKSCPKELDIINYLDEDTAPMFIWHNQHDKYVPNINPLMATKRLSELDIPVELHFYTGGEHGMSVANSLSAKDEKKKKAIDNNPNIRMWPDLCDNWLKEVLKDK